MSIAIAPQYTQKIYTWTNWKTIQTTKNLIYQYDEDSIIYTVYGYDGAEVHLCNIYKGEVPYTVVQSGYSQAQNDSDKNDFETNYISTANRTLEPRGVFIDRSGVTASSINTSTTVMPTNFARKYLLIQNSGNVSIWFNFTAAAVKAPPSILLPAGFSYVLEGRFISTEAVNIISGSPSVPFMAKEA